MLVANGANVNARNKEFNTPLHEAAWFVQSQMDKDMKKACCKILISSGAELDATNLKNKTPMDYKILMEMSHENENGLEAEPEVKWSIR